MSEHLKHHRHSHGPGGNRVTPTPRTNDRKRDSSLPPPKRHSINSTSTNVAELSTPKKPTPTEEEQQDYQRCQAVVREYNSNSSILDNKNKKTYREIAGINAKIARYAKVQNQAGDVMRVAQYLSTKIRPAGEAQRQTDDMKVVQDISSGIRRAGNELRAARIEGIPVLQKDIITLHERIILRSKEHATYREHHEQKLDRIHALEKKYGKGAFQTSSRR